MLEVGEGDERGVEGKQALGGGTPRRGPVPVVIIGPGIAEVVSGHRRMSASNMPKWRSHRRNGEHLPNIDENK